MLYSCQTPAKKFQSTLPIREETERVARYNVELDISIHSSHTGRDLQRQALSLWTGFQSTLPIREETGSPCTVAYGVGFQSTLPIREETKLGDETDDWKAFQSTLPIREETYIRSIRIAPTIDFNPLFPYGKRHRGRRPHRFRVAISIHSSHTGRDYAAVHRMSMVFVFQSTLPIREETQMIAATSDTPPNFNPLFPYGKRRGRGYALGRPGISIHSSHTGRDAMPSEAIATMAISIHSSHTGRDIPKCPSLRMAMAISIHSSHTGRDEISPAPETFPSISIHSSHTGRDYCTASRE